MAANTGQTPLVENEADGECARAPAFRSAMTCSTIA
jgi:hypothetical protein